MRGGSRGKRLVALLLTLPCAPATLAADATVSWQTVPHPGELTYHLDYGPTDGATTRVETAATSVSVTDLRPGSEYGFAVRACAGTDCSDFSETLTAEVPYAPPEADFSATPLAGDAPLTVRFTDASVGNVDSREWDLGDGTTASSGEVVHTYTSAGSYSVALTVTGPGGADTQRRDDYVQVSSPPPSGGSGGSGGGEPALLEAGEAVVDHRWQWVELEHAWRDPVVVARPASGDGDAPLVVRIAGVTPAGFWLSLQGWDDPDGVQVPERVGWLVAERGSHQAADGRRIEAGRIQSARTGGFQRVDFATGFAAAPVLVTAVASANDSDPVTSRVRRVTGNGFELGMREEEAADQVHGAETLGYIAIAPGSGQIGDLWVEAGMTEDTVTHRPMTLSFDNAFAAPPLFLAAMQTTDGGDSATLRRSFLSAGAVDLWVDEEQSRDLETRHTTEVVGYLALEYRAASAPPESPGAVYEDAENGDTAGWRVYVGSGQIQNLADAANGSRVIALQGNGTSTGYSLIREDGSAWADTGHTRLSFDLSYRESFRVYINVDTDRGQYYLEYSPAGVGSDYVWENYVHHGLDPRLAQGGWQRVERDLAADLAAADPSLRLRAVNGFLIRGSGRVDNIRLW